MKRGKFSLSYTKLLSGDMGELIPIGWHEALPGDTLQHSTSALVRAAPLLSPVMHPVEVRIHHWFVPNRLLWDNWENFITGVLTVWTLLSILLLPFRLLLSALWPTIWGFQLRLTRQCFGPSV